jgi:hypothetical protein
VLLVDREHHDLDGITLLEHFARVRDALGPRHVRDVHQTVDTLLELDEGAEVREVADLALDRRCPAGTCPSSVSHGSGSTCLRPSEMLLVGLVDLEHDRLDDVADVDDLRRGAARDCVHDISDTWIRPSMPFSSSMKAP